MTFCLQDLAKRDTSQNRQEDSSDGGLINKYLEVALVADEKVVETHGNKTDEFLLLMASIVRMKSIVNDKMCPFFFFGGGGGLIGLCRLKFYMY